MKKVRNGFIKNLNYLCLISVVVLGLTTVIGTGGCRNGGGDNGGEPLEQDWGFDVAKSEKPRNMSPSVELNEINELVKGNTDFALDLYHQLKDSEPGNLFYSPHSISIALAMAWAGSAGSTETQMADVLHFTLLQDRFHPAFNALDLDLMSRGLGAADEFRLSIVNAIWGQTGHSFEQSFLDVIAENYGTGLHLLDFVSEPEGSRIIINEWVDYQTEGRIENLLPEGSITVSTILVLTNAIYFKADWISQFDKARTQPNDFHLLGGGQVSVDMMSQDTNLMYVQGTDYQAVEMPYKGDDTSMVVILPDAGELEDFETSLNATAIDTIIDALSIEYMTLTMPKFSFSYEMEMSQVLKDMGMTDAFDPGLADFSGIDGTRELFISHVVHKAFVAVDEEGTEAAAATGVIMPTSAPPPVLQMVVDHPFIFLIRDKETGAILFLGRVLDPTA